MTPEEYAKNIRLIVLINQTTRRLLGKVFVTKEEVKKELNKKG
jgi:hypothetical protein